MKRLTFWGLVILSLVTYSCQEDNEDLSSLVTFFHVDTLESETFEFGEHRTFSMNGDNIKRIESSLPEGWIINIDEKTIGITAPQWSEEHKNKLSGKVILTAISNSNVQSPIHISFEVKILSNTHKITFENVDASYFAGPTSYGENLYSSYTGTNPKKYEGYLDETSGLFFNTSTTAYGFASGGLAISQWNNTSSAGHLNQCSVYYGDNNQKNGGNNNSSSFIVAFTSTREETGAYMFFKDKEYVIDHAYFTNNTFAVLSMMYGDQFGYVHNYQNRDWFKLIIIGEDKNGRETGRVECYLSDFRRPESGGIVKDWVKTDLTPLGKVRKVSFKMESSDGEGYWMNTPAYFCMDDIAIIL